jgi:hypothetical protein
MRYRRPYAARHTSVSWNLMIGRNALLVAKEHGHRPLTMLTVYAAWTEGAVESDVRAIRTARNPKDRRTIGPPRWHGHIGALLKRDQIRRSSGTGGYPPVARGGSPSGRQMGR